MVAQAVAKLKLDGKQFTDKLNTVGNNADNKLGKKFQALGTKIAGAFAVTEIVQFISKMVQLGDEIDNLAKQTDLSVEGVQALKVAAEESGVKFETVRPAISAMRRAIDEAKSGSDDAVKSFDTLGISTQELFDLGTEEIFSKVTESMASADAGALTFTASTKVLGAESTRLRSMLIDLGTNGFDEVKNKMSETGKVLDEDTVAVLDRFEQRAKDFTDGVRGDFARLTGQLLTFIEESTNLDSVEMRNIKGEIDGLKTSLDELRVKYQGILTAIQTAQENLESATKETRAAQDAYNQALFDAMTPAEQLAALREKQEETENNLETSLENQKQLAIDIEQKEADLAASKNEAITLSNKAADAAQRHRDAVQETEEFEIKYGRVLARNSTKDEELRDLKLAQKKAQEEMLNAQVNAETARIKSARTEEELLNLKVDQKEEEENIYNAKEATLEISDQINEVEGDINQAKIDQAEAEKTVKDKINETIAAKERLREKTQNEVNAIQALLDKEIEVNGESQRSIDLSEMLEKKKAELADLVGDQKEDEEDINASMAEQLDAVKEMKELFKTMTEEELNNLLSSIELIAARLADLPDVQNLDWLKNLSNLRFQGLNETRAKNVAAFLETLVNRINDLPEVKKDKFAFLESLSELDFGGLSGTQGRMLGNFILEFTERFQRADFTGVDDAGKSIKSVSQALNNLSEIKMKALNAFLQELKAISNGKDFKIKVDIDKPDTLKDLNIKISPSADTTMSNLTYALNTFGDNLDEVLFSDQGMFGGLSERIESLVTALESVDLSGVENFTNFVSSLSDLSVDTSQGEVVEFKFPEKMPSVPFTISSETLQSITDAMQGPDLSGLQNFTNFVSSLSDLSADLGGTSTVNFEFPDTLPSISLVMDQMTEDVLTSIDSSLVKLANLKGIVWH